MKKSLIALAVLAASGAAMAQSTVTLYGIADAYVGSLKNGLSAGANAAPGGFAAVATAANAAALSQTGVNSGGLNTSRWGLKGSEDLGGGLMANFQLEQGITLDSGAATNFTRQAWVGLSGGFGEVKLGVTGTAYDDLRGLVNNTGNLNMNPTGNVFSAAGGDFVATHGNMIKYASPIMGGLSAAVSYGFGENKNTTQSAADVTSLHVKYVQGPLAVGYGYQSEEIQGTTDTDFNMVGASYDFGVAKLVGAYNRTTRAGDSKDSEYQLGVSAPMGAVTLYAGYASGKTKVAGVGTEKASGYSLVATYSMSKRTTVYAGVKSVTEKNAATNATVGKLSQTAVGIRHTF